MSFTSIVSEGKSDQYMVPGDDLQTGAGFWAAHRRRTKLERATVACFLRDADNCQADALKFSAAWRYSHG